MEPKTKFNAWYLVLAVLGVLALQYFYAQSQSVEPISYSLFERMLNEGKIKSISISDKQLLGEFPAPHEGKSRFVTTRVDPIFAAKLAEKGVEFRGVIESTLLRDLLSWVRPIVLCFGVWWFLIRRMALSRRLLVRTMPT